jgi:hypothetical protein
MKAEPLQIRDKRFLINRLIEQAPKSTLVREFFKNADENAAHTDPENRRIEIYPVDMDGVQKLAFWNTGIGMDDDELKLATDLSSSINKQMAMDGNFGIGAKVSGLTMSREGRPLATQSASACQMTGPATTLTGQHHQNHFLWQQMTINRA